MNDGQTPKFRGVRVHASTCYNRTEGTRRASRNGRVSDLPPGILPYDSRLFLWSLQVSAFAELLEQCTLAESALELRAMVRELCLRLNGKQPPAVDAIRGVR